MPDSVIDNSFWFKVARGELPLDAIPASISSKVLDFLNQVPNPEELFRAAPLIGEEERGIKLAGDLLGVQRRTFSDIRELWQIEGLGPARAVELIRSIAGTDAITQADLGQGELGPGHPTFSASETELRFSYEILGAGPLADIRSSTIARYCTTCNTSAPSLNRELNTWESQVQITGLILDGEDEHIKYSIQMDLRMAPYDWMQPIHKPDESFTFPAKMQLNNSMIIDTEIKATGQRMTLVSRDVPCQVGRITQWPPYEMTLHTQDKIQYHNQADPLGAPVMRITDGTTFLLGPDFFFSVRTDIIAYRYLPADGERGLPAVELEWYARMDEKNRIHHYHIYRSANPELGKGSWVNVSGPILSSPWIDPNPPAGPLFYRIVPVMQDIFGKDYEGFPGQIRRIEPAASVFRR